MQLKIFFWAGRVAAVGFAPCREVGRGRERMVADSVGEFYRTHELVNDEKLSCEDVK
jgi:hypothetical protein